MQTDAIKQYARQCRTILKEAGSCYSTWFFDEHVKFPDFAFLQYFRMGGVKSLVVDYFVYFETHIDPEKKEGEFYVCTLEVGVLPSRPSQSHAHIFNNSIELVFETRSRNDHLEGRITLDRCGDGCISGLGFADYSLTLIHPGTEEPTKITNIREVPVIIHPIEVTCPKCLGKGQFVDMSIPEECFNSGLSDYELYSSNKVNSHNGCPMCGGNGTEYEEWFIKEKGISNENFSPVVPGTGRVIIGNNLNT